MLLSLRACFCQAMKLPWSFEAQKVGRPASYLRDCQSAALHSLLTLAQMLHVSHRTAKRKW